MEGMSHYEPERPREELFGEKSRFELNFFLSPELFERQTGIPTAKIDRLSYSPERNRFSSVERTEARIDR